MVMFSLVAASFFLYNSAFVIRKLKLLKDSLVHDVFGISF